MIKLTHVSCCDSKEPLDAGYVGPRPKSFRAVPSAEVKR